MIPSSIGYILEGVMKSIMIFISLYFSSLHLKYLKLTKLDKTRFVMKLFKLFQFHVFKKWINKTFCVETCGGFFPQVVAGLMIALW